MFYTQGRYKEGVSSLKKALKLVENAIQPMWPEIYCASHEARYNLELKLAEMYYKMQDVKNATQYYRLNRIHYLLGKGHHEQAQIYKKEKDDWVCVQMKAFFDDRKKTTVDREQKKRLRELYSVKCTKCNALPQFGNPFTKSCIQCNMVYCCADCKIDDWHNHRKICKNA
jgi:hypothetical protein